MGNIDNNKTPNDTDGKIPQVILKFLSGSGGRSILLKGAPGTGKTTFALELLNTMKNIQRVCFISARVEEQALKSHIPWLDFKVLLPKDMIASHPESKDEDSPAQKLYRSELDKLESRVEAGDEFLEDPYDREDGTGTIEGNTWTFDISNILPEIDRLYDTIEIAFPDKSLVVIDSIDALREKYGISSRRLIQTLQKDLVEKSNMNVVFIMEKCTPSDLDFLGDGVISLEMDELDGRRLRLMKIEKLRGFPIHSPRIPFTLEGGHFSCFRGIGKYMGTDGPEEHILVRDRAAKMELGGVLSNTLEEGAYNIIEIDSDVPVDVVQMLVFSLLEESLSKGRGTYALSSFRLFRGGLDQLLDQGAHANFKILNPVPMYDGILSSSYSMMIDGESIQEDLDWESIVNLLSESSVPYTFLMDTNLILALYGMDALPDLEMHISTLLRNKGTCIGFSWTSDTSAKVDFHFNNRLIKVKQVGGYTVVFGDKPYTPLYFLDDDDDRVQLQILI